MRPTCYEFSTNESCGRWLVQSAQIHTCPSARHESYLDGAGYMAAHIRNLCNRWQWSNSGSGSFTPRTVSRFSLIRPTILPWRWRQKFYVHVSVHRKRIFKYNQQDATLHSLFIFCEMLYMFQAVLPPIIRSSKLYIQHLVKTLVLPATVVEELEGLTNTRCCIYSFELPMMGEGTARNM